MKTNWNLCYPVFVAVLLALCLVKDCTCDEEVVKEVASSVVKKDNPLWHFEIQNGVSNPERKSLRRYLADRSQDIQKRFLPNYLEKEQLTDRSSDIQKRFLPNYLEKEQLTDRSSDIQKRFLPNYLEMEQLTPLDSKLAVEDETLNPLAKRSWQNRLQKRRAYPSERMTEFWSPKNLQKRLWKGLVPENCDDCEGSTERKLLRIWKGIMGMEDDESSDEELETEKRFLEEAEREEEKRMWKNIMGYNHMKGNLENIFEDYENL